MEVIAFVVGIVTEDVVVVVMENRSTNVSRVVVLKCKSAGFSSDCGCALSSPL